MGEFPQAIEYNPNNDKIYVAKANSDKIDNIRFYVYVYINEIGAY